jgi:hypothetical protein
MLLRKYLFILVSILLISQTVQAQQHVWSQRFGDSEWEEGKNVAVDGSGNVIITGHFKGTVDFGGGTLTSVGGWDIYVAKFTSGGTHLWSQRFGNALSTSDEYCESVAVDGSGNIIITGFFGSTIDFGGVTLTSVGAYDVFLAKFNPSGTHLWSQRFGNTGSTNSHDVTVDGSGNAIITGYFGGTVDFGGGTLTNLGSFDIFLAKFGPTGTHLWSQCFGTTTSWSGSYGIAVIDDGSENVIVTGVLHGVVDFGGGPLDSGGFDNIFLAKFGPTGTHLWSQRFGDSGGAYSEDVAVDGSGNVFITGDFGGTVDFGSGPLTSLGGDIFLAKFNPSGTHLWSDNFGDSDWQGANAVAVDSTDNVFITGQFDGTVDFGGGPLTCAGSLPPLFDIFVAKFKSDGIHVWSSRFGVGWPEVGNDVAVDAPGNVIITGYFSTTVDFGGGTLTSQGNYDIFVAKFDNTFTIPTITGWGVLLLVLCLTSSAIFLLRRRMLHSPGIQE